MDGLRDPPAPTALDGPLLGRSAERSAIDRLLVDARVGSSGALVLRGEAGIGKTSLLAYAHRSARGMAVLSARGVESEAEVPFGGLLELLRPALGEMARLPAPQADTLRGVLALQPASAHDRFAVGAATLNLLAAHAERAPLLLLVDDAHWLDAPSLDAVLFAVRRLVVDPVATLIAVRPGQAPAAERLGLPELAVRGVDRETASAIVAAQLGRLAAPGTDEHLWRLAAGNPLALVELAPRAAELQSDPPGAPVSVQTSVEDAFRRRLEPLSADARDLLLIAAADGSGDLVALAAAGAALGLDLGHLAEAERAGLISVASGDLVFAHPLARSAAYHAALPEARRAAHQALATVLDEDTAPDRHAWHLACAVLGPDAEAADALERAAQRAQARSAYATAARAAERAAQLTADPALRARRGGLAAEAAWLSGDPERALAALRAALALAPAAALRARLEHLQGQLTMQAGRAMDGHDLLMSAAALAAGHDPSAAIRMAAEASEACFYAARPEAMLQAARRAYALLEEDAGDRDAFSAHLALGTALVVGGQGDDGARHVRRAIAVLEASDALFDDPRLLASAAVAPVFLREAGDGAALVDRAIEAARREGAIGALPFALAIAGRYAATSDRWAVGESRYEEAMRLGRETGQGLPLCFAAAGLAGLLARQGREEECRAHSALALELAERHGLGALEWLALDALAEVAFAAGRPEEALAPLRRKAAALAAASITDPDVSPVPELVEASVRCPGRVEVEEPLRAFAALADAKGQPWALARLERSRGILAPEAAFEGHFARALGFHEATPDRFEEARTRLWYGERLRRARRRVQARVQLRAALERFEDLGAHPWATRARVELGATGEHARRRDPSTLDELTPQELQVAMLLAGGLTTREAAAKLFLSPKTVEHHLRNTYRKLSVRSRDALAEALGDRATVA